MTFFGIYLRIYGEAYYISNERLQTIKICLTCYKSVIRLLPTFTVHFNVTQLTGQLESRQRVGLTDIGTKQPLNESSRGNGTRGNRAADGGGTRLLSVGF